LRALFRLPVEAKAAALTVNVIEPLIGLVGGLTIIGVPGVTGVAGPNGVAVSQVAAIAVVPGETPLARPVALIVATPGADEFHKTEAVRFSVKPLL